MLTQILGQMYDTSKNSEESLKTDDSKTYFVYLLRCIDDTLYCGYTDDLEKRVKTHNRGKGAKYTRRRTPVTLVYSEEFKTKSEALKREHQIKKLSRKEKLALI